MSWSRLSRRKWVLKTMSSLSRQSCMYCAQGVRNFSTAWRRIIAINQAYKAQCTLTLCTRRQPTCAPEPMPGDESVPYLDPQRHGGGEQSRQVAIAQRVENRETYSSCP